MKGVSFLLMFTVLAVACKKDVKVNKALEGTWVDKDHQQDTLVVYRSGGKSIMFDNSVFYITQALQSPTAGRFQYTLKGDKIGIKDIDASAEAEFIYYDFEWIVKDQEFKMSYNGI